MIVRESRNFGLELGTWNQTLAPSTVEYVNRNREGYDWRVAGRETIDGMDFILVDFGRTFIPLSRLDLTLRSAVVPDTAEIYVRGRLWLEASTGDLWRDETGWFMEGLPGFSEDPPILQYEFQYARSSYGIFTPERFEFAFPPRLQPLLRGDSSPPKRTIQEFAPFERFDTDVQFFVEEPVR